MVIKVFSGLLYLTETFAQDIILKKARPLTIKIWSWLLYLTRSHSRICCSVRGALKAVKALCGLLSKTVRHLCLFLESQCHHKKHVEGCKVIQVNKD
jgi:hypothetical protein